MCDSIVAVGGATALGTTLYGKNSDREPGECQPLLQFPEAAHPPGAALRCTHLEIPQVAETYRVMGHSPWWVWGFEHGVNEHGVAIGNHQVFSKEPIEAQPGLIGMDLVRLGLERGRTAREALEVIATLLETHGQGGAADAPGGGAYHNSFVLADPREAWHLESSNRHWGARRVEVGAVSNHLAIGADWEIGSRDLEPFARSHGLWREKGRIELASAYGNPDTPPKISERRQRRAAELLEARRGRHDEASFRSILRDHAEAGPAWCGGDGAATPFSTLCAHTDPISWTTASLVASLPGERTAPWPVWAGFASPCCGIYLPVYLHGVVPAALARGSEEPDADSAWWTFKRLQDAASVDPPRHAPMLREGWVELEERMEAERLDVEGAARRAALGGDADRSAEIVSDFMARNVEAVLERAEELRARIQRGAGRDAVGQAVRASSTVAGRRTDRAPTKYS